MGTKPPQSFSEKALDVLWVALCVWIAALLLVAGCAIADWRPDAHCPVIEPSHTVSFPSEDVTKAVFHVPVDYDARVSSLYFGSMTPDMYAISRFKPAGHGLRLVEMRLVDFGGAISSGTAVLKIHKLGMEPADFWELCFFCKTYPEVGQGTSIIAVGSPLVLAGWKFSPFFWTCNGQRRLGLYLWGFGWNKGELFLVVKR